MRKKVLIIYNKAVNCENRNDYEAEYSVIFSAIDLCINLKKRGYLCSIFSVSSPIDKLFTKIKKEKPDFIFNLCEGFERNSHKEMNIAAILELLPIPFSGCSAKTLVIAHDKIKAKMLAKIAGIKTPEFQIIKNPMDKILLDFPLFLKSPFEDASIGISEKSYVENLSELRKKAEELFSLFGSPILAEKYIDGREFNVAVFGCGDEIKVLPPSEIIFTNFEPGQPKIVSYNAKWKENSDEYRNTKSICPVMTGTKLNEKLKNITLKLYQLFDADSYARADFRVDKNWNIYFIEFNPNPDISPSSGFRKALAAEKIDFANFAENLLEYAKRRYLKYA